MKSIKHFALAYSCFSEGAKASPAWHDDGIVVAACAVSTHVGDTQLESERKVGADGGQLIHEVGGIIYRMEKVMLFNSMVSTIILPLFMSNHFRIYDDS